MVNLKITKMCKLSNKLSIIVLTILIGFNFNNLLAGSLDLAHSQPGLYSNTDKLLPSEMPVWISPAQQLTEDSPALPLAKANPNIEEEIDSWVTIAANEQENIHKRKSAIKKLGKIVKSGKYSDSIRERALDALASIIADESVDPEIRKLAIDKLGKIAASSRLKDAIRYGVVRALVTIAMDYDTNSEMRSYTKEVLKNIFVAKKVKNHIKQKIAGDMLTMATDDSFDLSATFLPFILMDTLFSPEVNDTIKGKAIDYLAAIVKNEGSSHEKTRDVLLLLYYISFYVDTALQDNVFKIFVDVITSDNLNNDLRKHASWVFGSLVYISGVDEYTREKVLEYSMSIIRNEEIDPGIRGRLIFSLEPALDSGNVSEQVKEKVGGLLIAVVTDENLNAELRAFTFKGIGRHPDFVSQLNEITIQAITDSVLRMATDDTINFTYRVDVMGVLLGRINPLVSDAMKTSIKEGISTSNLITERNRRIWEEFGVLIFEKNDRPLLENETFRISAVLGSLPDSKRPKVISLSQPRGDWISGTYYPDSTVIKIFSAINDYWGSYVLFHEIGHYVDYMQFTPEQRREWDRLWDASTDINNDFATYYGRTDSREDFAEMFAAYTGDTRAILARAKSQARDVIDEEGKVIKIGRDILLEKVQLVADIFKHTIVLDDGRTVEATYVFKTNEDGTITRQEVALTKQEINGKEYLLPDFDRVYSEIIF